MLTNLLFPAIGVSMPLDTLQHACFPLFSNPTHSHFCLLTHTEGHAPISFDCFIKRALPCNFNASLINSLTPVCTLAACVSPMPAGPLNGCPAGPALICNVSPPLCWPLQQPRVEPVGVDIVQMLLEVNQGPVASLCRILHQNVMGHPANRSA